MQQQIKRSCRAAAICMCLAIAASATFASGCAEKQDASQTPEVTYPKYGLVRKETDEYTETPVHILNKEMDRKVYCLEIMPKDIGENKVPLVIYVHGGDGDITSVIGVPEGIAHEGIAGLTFECCGANRVNPGSDRYDSEGNDLYNPHYTSRMSDLEAVIEHAKTLDYVDTDRIYLCGQSYGGLVCMLSAPAHNDDVKGVFMISTGLTEDDSMVADREKKGIIEKYLPPEDYESYINTYTGDIMLFCSQDDETGAHDNSAYTETVYARRTDGRTTFYLYAGGGHSFNSFEQAAKDDTFRIIAEYIFTGQIPEQGENT